MVKGMLETGREDIGRALWKREIEKRIETKVLKNGSNGREMKKGGISNFDRREGGVVVKIYTPFLTFQIGIWSIR